MKKSLYIFLCSVTGMMLFFVLHRLLVFIYWLLAILSPAGAGAALQLTQPQFLVLDSFTLALALAGGGWYGIWLGNYWYEKVYERGIAGGAIRHLAHNYLAKKSAALNFEQKLLIAREKVRDGLLELENLPAKAPASVKPLRRRIARKKAPKKLKALN